MEAVPKSEATVMATTEATLILTLDDDLPGPIEVIVAEPATIGGPIRISPAPQDTAGQALDGWTLDVLVSTDDTEGQAMSLRFPNPAAAVEFQRRLLIAGALAGTMVAASVGASALTAGAGGVAAGPAAGYAHDADKVVDVSGPAVRVGVPASEFGLAVRAARQSSAANAVAANDATSVERARAQAAASEQAAVGAEAAAKAAQAAAVAAATEGGPAADEPYDPIPRGGFRDR
jgi:hypothetical protein